MSEQTGGAWRVSRQHAAHLAFWTAVVAVALVLATYLPDVFLRFPDRWNIGLRIFLDGLQDWIIANRALHPVFVFGFDPLSHTIDTIVRSLESGLMNTP